MVPELNVFFSRNELKPEVRYSTGRLHSLSITTATAEIMFSGTELQLRNLRDLINTAFAETNQARGTPYDGLPHSLTRGPN